MFDDNVCSLDEYYFPRRYVFVLLSFLGMVMLYALRVNLSVAIVSMVHPPLVENNNITNETITTTNETIITTTNTGGEFYWDERVQGIVLASFFWGYVITQLPGGRLADIFGTKWILFSGILFASVFTIVSPIAARMSYILFVVCRVFEGLFEVSLSHFTTTTTITFLPKGFHISCHALDAGQVASAE